jgi:hypothetical protein
VGCRLINIDQLFCLELFWVYLFPVVIQLHPHQYKISVLHLIQGDADRAAITFDLLEKNYSSQDFGYIYAELASVFRESYELEGLVNACAAAQEFADDHAKEIISPLGSETYGYANRGYFPKDICPWE